jgi:hypothetical protein
LKTILARGVQAVQFNNAKVVDTNEHETAIPNQGNIQIYTNELKKLEVVSSSFPDGFMPSFVQMHKSMCVFSITKCILEAQLISSLQTSSKLEDISVSYCDGLEDEKMKDFLCSHSKRLKVLKLSGLTLEASTLSQISKCINLEQLELKGCKLGVTDEVIREVINSCPKLHHLDVSDCDRLTVSSFETICKKGGQLESLCISHSFHIHPSNLW